MATTVYANNRLIIHKGDGFTETCPVPDFCKTPTPGGPVPMPYVNFAMDSALADGPTSVKIDGNMPAHMKANLRISSGDEGGTAGGGVVSNTIKNKMKWVMGSVDVKLEGKPAIRFMDTCLHNGNNPNTGSQPQQGSHKGTYPDVDEKTICPRCNKAISTHRIKEIKQDDDSKQGAKDLHDSASKQMAGTRPKQGHMLGVMKVKCPNGQTKTLAAASGVSRSPPGAVTRSMSSLGMTRARGPVNTAGQKAAPDSNPPGSCAAAKMIQRANDMGCIPISMTEVWFGKGAKDGHSIASCETCKKNLPAMLCALGDKLSKGG